MSFHKFERRAELLDAVLAEINADLSDCPFCGQYEAEVTPGINNCWVQCGHCHTAGPVADTPQEAAKFWNQRKTK